MIECGIKGNDFFAALNTFAKENSVPLNVTFELTPFCNFKCVMCYVRLDGEQAKAQGRLMTADEWLGIARQARDMGTLEICLTGGEPLTHPEFWKLYGELNKMGFLITILSNGSLIDEAAIEKFRELGMPYAAKITVYGASDETYKRVCGVDGGFAKMSRAVDLLKESGVPLRLTATIVRENADDLQQIHAFAREKGLPLQHTVTVVKSARGATNTAESSRFAFDEFSDELTLDVLEKNKFPPLESPFAWCASFGSSLWITWNGHLQLCSFMNKPYVRYSGSLSADFAEMNRCMSEIKSPAECSQCEWQTFCQRCPGVLCAESGDPEKISSSLCSVAERLHKIYHNLKNKEN